MFQSFVVQSRLSERSKRFVRMLQQLSTHFDEQLHDTDEKYYALLQQVMTDQSQLPTNLYELL